MSQFFPGPGPTQEEFESAKAALNDYIANLIKIKTESVTTTASGSVTSTLPLSKKLLFADAGPYMCLTYRSNKYYAFGICDFNSAGVIMKTNTAVTLTMYYVD